MNFPPVTECLQCGKPADPDFDLAVTVDGIRYPFGLCTEDGERAAVEMARKYEEARIEYRDGTVVTRTRIPKES